MRIIAGTCRGAQICAPRGMDTRPTQDKVRESLFSIIQAYVPGASVLDLFAGSGALGLEALSRGAGFAALADHSREAAACIRKNIEKLRLADATRLYLADWRQALAQMKAEGDGASTWSFLTRPTDCRCWKRAARRWRSRTSFRGTRCWWRST